MTLDEFLAWDDGTDRRYELYGGGVTAMALPMPRHGMLGAALRGESAWHCGRVPPESCGELLSS
jgi:hypothetical protein